MNAFSDEEVKQLLSNAVILDGVAAAALIKRGLGKYLGLSSPVLHYHNVSAYSYEEIDEADPAVYGVPYPRLTLQRACRQLWEFTPADAGVKVLSVVKKYDHTTMFGCTFSYRNALGGKVIVLATPMGDQGDDEWFYMGYFNPFRRIFMQKLLRHAAPDMAGCCTEDFPCQTVRISYDGGVFFAALNATSDPAPQIVLNIQQMPEGTLEVLSESGTWESTGDVTATPAENNGAKLTFARTLPQLSTLMFRIKE